MLQILKKIQAGCGQAGFRLGFKLYIWANLYLDRDLVCWQKAKKRENLFEEGPQVRTWLLHINYLKFCIKTPLNIYDVMY